MAYVEGCPTLSTDPLGLFKIFFPGKWSQKQKSKITDGIKTIADRAKALKAEAESELKKLPACERAELEKAVNDFVTLMQSLIEGIESSAPIYFYHEESQRDGRAWNLPAIGFYNHRIYFNDSTPSPMGWETMSDFNSLLFHELTHLWGTNDEADDPYTHLTNAHKLTMIYSRTFKSSVWWTEMKKEAAKKCAKPKPPTPRSVPTCPPLRCPDRLRGDDDPLLYIMFL